MASEPLHVLYKRDSIVAMTAAQELEYAEHAPLEPLSAWVKCIWTLRAPAGLIGEPQPILPDGCMEIVYNLAGPFRRTLSDGRIVEQAGVIVVGPQTRPVTVQPGGTVDLVGVRFHPWGGGLVTDASLREIRDETPAAATVGTILPHDLGDRLWSCGTFADRVAVIEGVLAGRIRNAGAPAGSLVAAVQRLTREREPLSIRALAGSLGTTQRTMQRHFENMVGLSPRFYSRVARMQRAMGMRMRDESCSWSRVAQMAGYYDHAHMVHDFSELAGFAPTAFDEEERTLTENFIR